MNLDASVVALLKKMRPDAEFRVKFAHGSIGVDAVLRSECEKRGWELPAASVSAEYEREWAESRRALLQMRAELGESALCSLSHSRGWVMVLGVSGPLRSVGVDLERLDRKVSARLQERYVHESEKGLGLSPIEIWVVKEACFKANHQTSGTVVSDYEILEFDRGQAAGLAKHDSVESPTFHFGIIKDSEWIAGVALTD